MSRRLAALAVTLVASAGTENAFAADSVVLLREGADARGEATRAGASNARVYPHVGAFVAGLSASQRGALRSDPDVVSVTADRMIKRDEDPEPPPEVLPTEPFPRGQIIPAGVRRIGGLRSPTADIDGAGGRVDADIAILDSRTDPKHGDLNFAGGVNCAGRPQPKPDSHGTLVAGSAAALDNGRGVVGSAPGARVWGVTMYDFEDFTSLEIILCSVDWVIANARTIEVANMSSSFEGFDDPNCGVDPPDPVHAGICRSVRKGTTWVVSAGNEAADAVDWVPAAFDEVIAVSALADYDGRPGGKGRQTCLRGVFDLGADDTFAVYSNFGADVDLMAPGNCVLSTATKDTREDVDSVTNFYFDGSDYYATTNGTSFSAPYVAGAAALYMTAHKRATPVQVLQALRANRERGPVPGDPDGINEGIVNVTGF
jgi:subtilisin family serine protease